MWRYLKSTARRIRVFGRCLNKQILRATHVFPMYLDLPVTMPGLTFKADPLFYLIVVHKQLKPFRLYSQSQKTTRYCWPTSFKVLGVLYLAEVSLAFLPSKKACWTHKFRHLGVGQQYPSLFRDSTLHKMTFLLTLLRKTH